MTTSMTQLIHMPRSVLFSGLVVLSGFISLAMQTPTHALSLDLGKTVTTVVNSVPIVNTITPLLMAPTITTPVVTTPAVTVPTTPVVTPAQTTPSVTSAPATTSTAATTPSANTIGAPSSQALSTTASNQARAAITPVGLSVATKQNEIAAAAAHPASPAVTYTSRALDPKVAGTIFYLGIAGIFIGGCVMFAVRPRMAVA